MPIRVRPSDVEVPPDDPFQNDLLDRKPSIEALTDLLSVVEGPCVLALDSKWGGGKTTFLKMWAAHLRNEGFAVAEFNAWETDFSGEPFVALSSRLDEHFSEDLAEGASEATQRFAEAAKRVALRAAPILIRILSQGLLDSGSLEQAIAEQAASHAQDRLDEFREGQKSIHDFRDTLREEATRLSALHNDYPFFVMIDELDRCRPSYTIEFLEVAKHLFSVNRIVFVLAVNREQLAHSVNALYGERFDAKGYLYRFHDLEYVLPLPDRERFVSQAISDTGLNACLESDREPYQAVTTMIARLLAWSNLDLRRIAQAIRRLALVCAPLEGSSVAAATAASVALTIRTIEPDIFAGFCSGKVQENQVIEGIYEHGKLRDLKDTAEGYFVEAVLAHGWLELFGRMSVRSVSPRFSPLISSYSDALQNMRTEEINAAAVGRSLEVPDEQRAFLQRAEGVLAYFRQTTELSEGNMFSLALKRIDLLSSN